jgi:PAS domain S-box-containing protein
MGEEAAVRIMKSGAQDYVMKDKLARLAPAVERELKEAQLRREHRQAEEGLRKRELQLNTILQTSSEAFCLVSTDARFIEVNDAACAMFGYSREELLRMRIQDVDVSEAREETAARMERIRREGSDRFEKRYRRKDGRIIHVEISANFLDLGGGQFVSFLRDITERKQAEKALWDRIELQDLMAKIAATVPGMIYSFRLRPDGSSALPYASPSLEEICGLRPDQVVLDAAVAFDLVHPDDRERVKASISESARTLTPWRDEFRVRHPRKGELWLEGHSVP